MLDITSSLTLEFDCSKVKQKKTKKPKKMESFLTRLPCFGKVPQNFQYFLQNSSGVLSWREEIVRGGNSTSCVDMFGGACKTGFLLNKLVIPFVNFRIWKAAIWRNLFKIWKISSFNWLVDLGFCSDHCAFFGSYRVQFVLKIGYKFVLLVLFN